jgi:hypothetical protein
MKRLRAVLTNRGRPEETLQGVGVLLCAPANIREFLSVPTQRRDRRYDSDFGTKIFE